MASSSQANNAEGGDIETARLLRRSPRPNPLPKAQLAVIYAIKLTIPIALTQALPYINVLVEELAASEGAETGYYSGLAHSSFAIAQLSSMFIWGRISDSIGRIPVILIGTTGTAIFTALFGLSRSLSVLLINRFLTGIFCGTTGAIHSVVGELSDSTNQSIAFPLYDICSALGFVIGPLIGGTFANPAARFPEWFNAPFWRAYPYVLPCFVASVVALIASFLAMFVLEETLVSKRVQKLALVADSYGATQSQQDLNDQSLLSQPLSVKTLLFIPVIRAICASSGALGFAGSCFNSVFVLMAYTPIQQGGLALSPSQIGRALSAMGAVSIVLKLGMPLFLRRFGTLGVFDFCMIIWPVTFAAMPILSWIAKRDSAESDAAEWIAVGLVLFLSRLGCLAFSIIMILIKDHTPGTSSLGTANGMAELAQSLAASFGPTIASSLFALSASKNLLGGYLWVVFMIVVSSLGSSIANRIKLYRD